MDIAFLTLSIVSGQLLKIPFLGGGLNLIDVSVIILCLWGALGLRFKLQKPPLWIKASFIFITIACLSLILTPVKLNFWEFIASISYLIRFCFYILFGWLISSDAFPNIKKHIQKILIFSGLSLATLGILQLIFLPDLRFLTAFGWDPHYFRAASTFLDPNFLGTYLVLTLLTLYQIKKRDKLFYIIFAVTYICLLLTFSRGSYLAFITSFALLSFLNKSFKQLLASTFLFLTLLLGFYTYQHLVAQPRGINRTQSAEFRLSTWQQGWQLFLHSPILGIGFNTYRYGLKQYNIADETFLKSHGSSTNDSSFLYVLAVTGIIGFIAYLYFLLTLFKIGLKDKILSAALIGIISQSFFANTLFYPPIILWVILAAAQKK